GRRRVDGRRSAALGRARPRAARDRAARPGRGDRSVADVGGARAGRRLAGAPDQPEPDQPGPVEPGPIQHRSAEVTGTVAIVLHAHLPYVRHPEYRYHLEENWLYEAITATYLPLLEVFRGLERDRVRSRVTMSMSPPLVNMLRDDLLKTRTAAYIDRLVGLGEQEVRRTAGDTTFNPLARFYLDRFQRLRALYDAL